MDSDYIAARDEWILITGSNGFIGAKVVKTLLDYGFSNLCCFVRPSSQLGRLQSVLDQFDAGRNVRLLTGDLLSREDCRKAVEGVAIIYHLAAGFDKSFAGAFMNSALATRNLLDAFVRYGRPRRFVNVSSFAVYSNLGTFGLFVQVNGSNLLPLSFVDNCAEAIVLAGLKPGVEDETFNVVDNELLTGRQFLRAYKRKVNRFASITLPYSVGYAMCLLWEKYSKWSKGQLPPAFNRRRCSAEWKANRFPNWKLRERLGWQPRVPMKQAMEAFLAQFESNGNDSPLKG
jgi:nucleoside-diphosphate-sugar epimerase